MAGAVKARAVGPDLQVAQYGHFAWRLQEGSIRGTPYMMAQTLDGYLWIGTEAGLLKFDGVRFIPWKPSNSDTPSFQTVYSLLATKDGALWIGTPSDLARLKDGVVSYPVGKKIGRVNQIVQTSDGTVWFTRSVGAAPGVHRPLCRVEGSSFKCFGAESGIVCGNPESLNLGRNQDLMLGCTPELNRWHGGLSVYAASNEPKGNMHVPQHDMDHLVTAAIDLGPDRTVVGFTEKGPHFGLQEFSKGKWKSFDAVGLKGDSVAVGALLQDDQGALWIGTTGDGLYHVVNGRADHFGMAEGLSGDEVGDIRMDREGSVWVATSGGIDRFHRLKMTSYSTRQGMASNQAESVAAMKDGSLAVSLIGGLSFLRKGGIFSIPSKPGGLERVVFHVMVDHKGDLWVSSSNKFGRLIGNKIVPIAEPDEAFPESVAEDTQHTIWTRGKHSIMRVEGNRLVTWAPLPPEITRFYSIVADPYSGFWAVSGEGAVLRGEDGQSKVLSGPQPSVSVSGFLVEPDRKLWAWGSKGLLLWNSGKWRVLNAKAGLPCDNVFSAVDDKKGNFWFFSECGVFAIATDELNAWAGDSTLKVQPGPVMDGVDGVLGSKGEFGMTTAISSDGRIWFAHDTVLQSIDPQHLPMNDVPPPVHIEQIAVDHRPFVLERTVSLPKLTRDLEIDYTALSLMAPSKVRFKYKLSGIDKEWQDVGSRRQAFYMNLPPGSYSFQVIACNNDRVWNMTGDSIRFVIPPAFYQTRWFMLLLICFGIVFVSLVLQIRLRIIKKLLEAQLRERFAERDRIARELHDTLLQGVQGLVLNFQAGLDQISGDDPARAALRDALDRADTVLAEARNRVHDLRDDSSNRPSLLSRYEQVAEDLNIGNSTSFKVITSGLQCDLGPIAYDHIFAVGREAIVNAFRHAKASEIVVEIQFSSKEFLLICSDNGCGLPDATRQTGRAAGRYGLLGMRERARQLRAELNFGSGRSNGTVITLRVPGRIAYGIRPQHLSWAMPWFRNVQRTVLRDDQ